MPRNEAVHPISSNDRSAYRTVPRSGHSRRRRVLDGVALLSVAVTLFASFVWGSHLQRKERRIKIGAAPFSGEWDFRLSWRIIPAVAIGLLLVTVLPCVLARFRFPAAAWMAGAALALYALALAAADGANAVLAPVVDPTEYWGNLANLPSASTTLRSFASYDFLVQRSVHLKGHPPGFIMLLKGLAAIGLGRPWVTGALSFIGALTVVPAVALTVRAVVGELTARRALPYLACAPFAVWLGTSADAFFSAVCAWGIAAVALAVGSATSRHGRVSLGLAGGTLLAAGLFLSYGVVPLLALPAILVLHGFRRQRMATFEVIAAATIGALGVTALFAAKGFWWLDGLNLTREFYWNGSAYFRTWTYFLVGNLGALLIAVGPAVAYGIWRLRNRAAWLVVGGALLGVAAAEVSQYSKGEVERIWLLFMPWLLVATAVLRRSTPAANGPHLTTGSNVGLKCEQNSERRWLAVQVAIGLSLQIALKSKW